MGTCNNCGDTNLPSVNEESVECCEFYPADCVKTTKYNSYFKIGVGKTLTYVIDVISKKVKSLQLLIEGYHNYTEYQVLLSQTGITAPTAVVQKNEFSSGIVYARSGAGQYTGTLVGAFIVNKTVITLGSFNKAWGADVKVYRVDDDTIAIETGSTTGFIDDDVITDLPLNIKVYN